MISATAEERERRDLVVGRVLDSVRSDVRILLPRFDAGRGDDSVPNDLGAIALVAIAREKNDFGGTVGGFCYSFEGEDDLLHLFVVRRDGLPLSVEEGQAVFSFLLPDLATGLVWLKPGNLSQHFYFGHDELLRS